MKRLPPRLAWVRLTDAAAPYGLRMQQTEYSVLPDLVILRPDGSEVGRFRYFEPENSDPLMRTIFPHAVSRAEQAEVEAHIARRLGPLLVKLQLQLLWLQLLELQDAQ